MLEILKDNFQGTYYMYWLDPSIPNFTQKINVTFLNKPRNLMQCFKLLKILLSIDFIVVAGGQKYRWPLKSGLAPQFIIPLLARMLGKPLFFFSIGIEPNNDSLWAKFIKDISETTTFISVRDQSSFNYLIKLGVKKAFLSKDVVFYYIKNHKNEIELLKLLKRNKAERKVVGLAIRCSEISRDILEYYIPRLIEELLNNNYHLLFLPATDGDLNLLKGYLTSLSPPLRHKITLVESTEPKVLIKSIAYSDVLISLRLHFLPFALAMGTPIVGIDFPEKVKAFCVEAGIPICHIRDTRRIVAEVQHIVYMPNSGSSTISKHVLDKNINDLLRNIDLFKKCCQNFSKHKTSGLMFLKLGMWLLTIFFFKAIGLIIKLLNLK